MIERELTYHYNLIYVHSEKCRVSNGARLTAETISQILRAAFSGSIKCQEGSNYKIRVESLYITLNLFLFKVIPFHTK